METLEKKGMGAVKESSRPSHMPLIRGTEGTAAMFTELRKGTKIIAKGNQ